MNNNNGARIFQRNSFPSFAALRAFSAYGRLGGIRKAAQALNVDHAVISRSLRALEEQVGVALVDRSGADQLLTEYGSTYYARIAAALGEIADATDVLRRRNDKNFLLWCAPGFAHRWLLPRLVDFNFRHPAIDLALRPSDRHVDFGQNEADGEIRYIRSWNPYDPPPGVRTLEFDRPAIFPVASPDFLAKMERPLKHISDLANVQLIHEEDDEEWRRWLHAHHVVVDAPLKGSRLWHANLSIDAAIEGQGIALVNDRLVRDLIGAGRLQRVTFTNEPVCHVELGGYTLIARIDRWNSTSLARFRDWLGTNINSVK